MERNQTERSSLVAAQIRSQPAGPSTPVHLQIRAACEQQAGESVSASPDFSKTNDGSQPCSDEIRVALENARAAMAAIGDAEFGNVVGRLTRAQVLMEVDGQGQGARIAEAGRVIGLYRPSHEDHSVP